MQKLIVALALLVILVAGGLALANLVLDRTQVNTHTVGAAIREIVVTSGSGDVELVPGRRVTVRETQHYLVKKPTFERAVADGVLTIESRCEAYVVACHADLRVSVPAGVAVTVDADSGDVDARRIDVRSVHVQDDSGDIRMRLVGRQRLVWAHAGSGGVVVGAANARAVDAQSNSGDVVVAAGGDPRRIVAATDSGDVTVAVARGEYAVDADSDSGELEIQDGIARNDRARRAIDAHTDTGDVTLKGG